jgi:protein-tyrosine phosphatase
MHRRGPYPSALISVDDAVDSAEPWLWWARNEPPLLAGMSRPPAGFPYGFLADAGFTDLICLLPDATQDPAPLRRHHHPLQDLVGGARPEAPHDELGRVLTTIEQVETLLAQGRSVVVHCGLGNGRTGTVIGSCLVRAGHAPAEVTSWLDAVQKRRGIASGWPESAWQAETLHALAR